MAASDQTANVLTMPAWVLLPDDDPAVRSKPRRRRRWVDAMSIVEETLPKVSRECPLIRGRREAGGHAGLPIDEEVLPLTG